jgi:hypothetical protein
MLVVAMIAYPRRITWPPATWTATTDELELKQTESGWDQVRIRTTHIAIGLVK